MKTLKLIFSFFIFFFLFETIECHELAFIKVGTYTKPNYRKTWFFSRFLRGSWKDAYNLCHSFGMQLATFETEDEYKFVKQQLETLNFTQTLPPYFFHIGGVKYNNEWYWIHNGNKINYNKYWTQDMTKFIGFENACLLISSPKHWSKVTGQLYQSECNLGYANESFLCQVIESKHASAMSFEHF